MPGFLIGRIRVSGDVNTAAEAVTNDSPPDTQSISPMSVISMKTRCGRAFRPAIVSALVAAIETTPY